MTGHEYSILHDVKLKRLVKAVVKHHLDVHFIPKRPLSRDEIELLDSILPEVKKRNSPMTAGRYVSLMKLRGISHRDLASKAREYGITLPKFTKEELTLDELCLLDALVETLRERTPAKPLIGIVDTIDPARDYGVLVTNSLGFRSKSDDPLRTVFFLPKDLPQEDPIAKGDPVLFSLSGDERRRTIISRLTFDEESLKIGFKYSGELAAIKGSHHGREYDYNVAAEIIDGIRRSNPANSKQIVVEALAEYLVDVKKEFRAYVYPYLLQNKPLLLRLSALVEEMKGFSNGTEEMVQALQRLRKETREATVKEENRDVFLALPRDFDLSDKVPEVIRQLEAAITTRETERVQHWIRRQGWFKESYKEYRADLSPDLQWHIEEAFGVE